MANKDSSGLVGGNWKCELHGIDTNDVKVWNKHQKDYPDIHFEQGQTLCIDCGKTIKYDGVPPHETTPQGKNISLRCKGCLTKYIDSNKALLGLS
jgi:hypothetical protein